MKTLCTWSLTVGLLALGCASDPKPSEDAAGGSSGSGGMPVAGVGGTAGSGGAGSSAGGLGAGGGSGSGGGGRAGSSAGAGAGGAATGCKRLSLAEGETGPNGTIRLYTSPANSLSSASGLGLSSGYLYMQIGSGSSGKLLRVPVAGGATEEVGASPGTNVVLHDDSLYFLESGADGKHPLKSAPLSDPSASKILVDDIVTLGRLQFDATHVYWYTNAAGLWSVPLAGGTPQNLAPLAEPKDLVLQGDFLYWLDFQEDDLERVATSGGTPESVLNVLFGDYMAADDANLYWADGSNGNVYAFPVGGSARVEIGSIVPSSDDPSGLVVDAGTVFFSSGFSCTRVFSVGRDGTNQRLVAEGFDAARVFAVDATHVFVSSLNGIYRTDR